MSRDGRARRCRSVLDRRLLIGDGSRARLPQDLTEGCTQPFGMTRPDDDLQLLALDNSKHPVETLDGLHVSGLWGDEVEPQPRHAIGEGLDVIRTPDEVEYSLRKSFVIHDVLLEVKCGGGLGQQRREPLRQMSSVVLGLVPPSCPAGS